MITHTFICNSCGLIATDTDTKKIHVCGECGKDMRWDLDGIAIHGNYLHPVHSDSLAINPDQVEEHRKLFPNIEVDKQCRPIFDNFVDHENYLKKCNIVKHPQKMKPKGKIIAKSNC